MRITKGKTRTVVATVEQNDGCEDVVSVCTNRTITLNFPNAVSGYAGERRPFVKKMNADEARALGQALIEAAEEITGAEVKS
jgi:hypothetical protein